MFSTVALVTLLLAAQTPGGVVVGGVVRDATGQVVSGATVIAQSPGGAETIAMTGPDGRFSVAAGAGLPLTLVVRALGFAEASRPLGPGVDVSNVELVLQPASFVESVHVTAYGVPQRLQDVPASVNSLSRDDIRRSPAVVADDILRQVPTFSLFRRTSSLASHPTAQGVSLRGIGPSGVSRTLVLLDGVPFNDPFGGWVYWTKVPLAAAERIEVVDSASSSLYGNYAMGGVINIITAQPGARTFQANAQYGSRDTQRADLLASDRWGRFGLMLDAAAFSTDGYPIVVDVNPAGVPERGRVDKNASASFQTANVKADYRSVTGSTNAFVRGSYFHEDRVNGKFSSFDQRDEENDTEWKSASGGLRTSTAAGFLDATAFVDVGRFRSNFLAVPAANPPRSIGRMSLNQVVPSRSGGARFEWSAPGIRHTLKAGADWRYVDGDSEEDVLDPVRGADVILRRVSGGTQQSYGAWLQGMLTPASDLSLTLSARVDGWRNYDAHNFETSVPSGAATANHDPSLPDRSDTAFSPRVSARYRVTDALSVWGNIGAGFRAPTLNELYRQFRVGTVLTLANNQLGPERLVGGELGVTLVPARNVMLRSTYFLNRVDDPVSNVTIATAGALVTQQRQNLGRTRIQGLQNDVEVRVGSAWRFTGGYLYERAEITEFAANPSLVGNRLPQVPAHRGSLQVVYADPRYATVAFALQAVGAQFDDDQNVRTVPGFDEPGLPGYGLASLSVTRALGRNLDAFFGVQNLLDREYFVGTLPTTVGTPRLVTFGLRVRFPGDKR